MIVSDLMSSTTVTSEPAVFTEKKKENKTMTFNAFDYTNLIATLTNTNTREENEKKQRISDRKIGFENDEIFLLSIEEYKRYKGDIPELKTWWWLRSSGHGSTDAAYVYGVGSVFVFGNFVLFENGAVRPALKYSNLKSIIFESEDSDYFTWNRVIWKIIDRDSKIAISLMPIDFGRFDNCSTNYCSSKIRGWLLDWYKSGVDN